VATVLLPPGTLTNNGHGHGHGHASSQPAAATSAPGAQAKGAADSSAGGGGATGGGGGWLSNAASGGIGSGGGASGAPSDVQLVGWLESRLRDYEDLQLRHWALEAEHRYMRFCCCWRLAPSIIVGLADADDGLWLCVCVCCVRHTGSCSRSSRRSRGRALSWRGT
jgi:hypothetical protein